MTLKINKKLIEEIHDLIEGVVTFMILSGRKKYKFEYRKDKTTKSHFHIIRYIDPKCMHPAFLVFISEGAQNISVYLNEYELERKLPLEFHNFRIVDITAQAFGNESYTFHIKDKEEFMEFYNLCVKTIF